MVETLEIVWALGFGVFIGAFLGFVLSRGDVLFAAAGAVILGIVTLVYAFTLGQTGGVDSIAPKSH